MDSPDNPPVERRDSLLWKVGRNAFFPPVAAALCGLVGVFVCVALDAAGVLLLGMPLAISVLAAFFATLQRKRSDFAVYVDAFVAQLLVGLGILLFNLDGLICLAMALPVSAFIAFPGALIGAWLGITVRERRARLPLLLFLPMFPGLIALEHSRPLVAPLRKVVTRVEIDAPRQRVWDLVVAFPKIDAPPRGILNWGIAYPTEATIEGRGPGALRYCTFNTGSFVEPITRWEEPALLAFDVTENPPPIREVTLWEKIDPPHIHDRMISKRGQFRLEERDGRTILEGTTWYRHSLFPQAYWGPVSDYIIHRIHERVLWHIRDVAEGRGQVRAVSVDEVDAQ